MKRCPECLFIYPDSDSHCDFDNSPLVVADEAEIDAATTPPPAKEKKRPAKSSKRKLLIITSLAALAFLFLASLTYFVLTRRSRREAQTVATIGMPAGRIPLEPAIVASTPAASPSPSPSPAEPAKPATQPQRVATAHANTTSAPVSTSGPGLGKKLGGKPLILLTSGGKIEADEVWRTKDGVWYRRDGIVTLLKQGRVKAIVNQ